MNDLLTISHFRILYAHTLEHTTECLSCEFERVINVVTLVSFDLWFWFDSILLKLLFSALAVAFSRLNSNAVSCCQNDTALLFSLLLGRTANSNFSLPNHISYQQIRDF